MIAYPALFKKDADGLTVTFRDVPEAITCSDTPDEAQSMAVDALETALSFYISDRNAKLPMPTPPKRGERMIELTPLGTAKVELYRTMKVQKIGKAELARRLGCHLPQIDRLLDLCHESKLEQIERALAVLGKRIRLEILDAA